MLQSASSVFVVYRRKTLIGSPDPTRANGTDNSCRTNIKVLVTSRCFLLGFMAYINDVHSVDVPPNQFWFCAIGTYVLFAASLCSAWFIQSMTFDRFYSIIKPHRAASFNTMKRAKITIISIVVFSILFNVPHLFMTINGGRQCIRMVIGMDKWSGQFYYWFSFIVSFSFPFDSLLTMNSFIIHTIGNSSRLQGNLGAGQGHHQGQGPGQGQSSKLKSSEKQVFAILLLVTFGFLVMTTPSYVFFLYVKFYNYTQIAKSFAFYHLFVNVAHKMYIHQLWNEFLPVCDLRH